MSSYDTECKVVQLIILPENTSKCLEQPDSLNSYDVEWMIVNYVSSHNIFVIMQKEMVTASIIISRVISQKSYYCIPFRTT